MKTVVIKVSMNGHTSSFCCFCPQDLRSKAMELAAGFPGVQLVELMGDQDHIEVKGDFDAVDLTTKLRKKVGFAEIVSLNENEIEEETQVNPGDTTEAPPVICSCPRREIVYLGDPYPGPWCWPL